MKCIFYNCDFHILSTKNCHLKSTINNKIQNITEKADYIDQPSTPSYIEKDKSELSQAENNNENYELLEENLIKVNIVSNNKGTIFNITTTSAIYKYIKNYQICSLYLNGFVLNGIISSIEMQNCLCLITAHVPTTNKSINTTDEENNNKRFNSNCVSPPLLIKDTYIQHDDLIKGNNPAKENSFVAAYTVSNILDTTTTNLTSLPLQKNRDIKEKQEVPLLDQLKDNELFLDNTHSSNNNKNKTSQQNTEQNNTELDKNETIQQNTEQNNFELDKNAINLIKKFKEDNRELFQDKYEINSKNIVTNIEHYIFQNSLQIKRYPQLPIGNLKVQIQASWVKFYSGTLDLSNKIKFMCTNNELSTFTPQKLINSWPKIFSYFPHSSHATKYYVYYSNLIQNGSELVKLNNDLAIKKHIFTPELSLGWEFNQLETEMVNFQIQNTNSQLINHEKTISLNLHNVQEYITDDTCMFFSSRIGQSILDLIINALQVFIYNSNFNIEIEFQMPICAMLNQLDIGTTIKIKNYSCIITNIDVLYTANKKLATITCMTTTTKNNTIATKNNTIQNSKIHKIKAKMNKFGYKDIIESIQVQNTSAEQQKKLTHSMSVSQITDILNKNQTKIIIKTKPLKRSHNNYTVMEYEIPISINDKLQIIN